MLAPEIIITAPPDDQHGQRVCSYLRNKHPNTQVALVDTAHMPQKLACDLAMNTRDSEIQFSSGDDSGISFENVKSMWWWRPRPPVIDKRITDARQANFAYRQCCQILEGLWYLIDCLWVNQPERQEVALNRLYQLQAAKAAGFKVPETLVTSQQNSAVEFLERHKGKVVYRQLLPLAHKTFFFKKEDYPKLRNLHLSPIMFQEIVKLDAWLNVIIIGEAVYPVRIFQKQEASGKYTMEMQKYTMLNDVRMQLLNLVRHTGLLYTRLNMGIDKSGDYVFFEMNPTATFLDVEQQVKLPLTETLGELLWNGRVKETQRYWPTLPKPGKYRYQSE